MTKSTTSHFDIWEFLDESEVQDRIGLARSMSASVFRHARHPLTKRGSQNCIIGVDAKLSDLRDHIIDKIRRPSRLFGYADLPPHLRAMRGYRDVEMLLVRMQKQIMLLALLDMRNTYEIYILGGDWMITQSAADESVKYKERTQRIKRDDRTYHGRPKRDRERRRATMRALAV